MYAMYADRIAGKRVRSALWSLSVTRAAHPRDITIVEFRNGKPRLQNDCKRYVNPEWRRSKDEEMSVIVADSTA